MTDTIEHDELTWSYGSAGDPCTVQVPRNGDERKLVKRCREVPHECGDPECPGKKNKFQLDNYAEMLGTLRDSEKQFDALVETLAERAELLAACHKRNANLDDRNVLLRADRDWLRALVQRTLNYMRETDSPRTVKEVIADLTEGLVVKT